MLGIQPGRLFAALLTLVCLVAGLGLAAAHPLLPALALVAFAGVALAALWRPGLWMFLVPACLPALNFSPWSGWLTFDEFDLLMLAVLAGGYGRVLLSLWSLPPTNLSPLSHWRTATWAVLPLAVFCAGAWALARGWIAAPAALPSFFQDYMQPLNGLRVFKSLLWATLAVPLLRDTLRHSPRAALSRYALGMAVGMALVTFAVLWERLAFPGLLNFTSKYRTTAWFWEMHVGGAAIDAYLALAAPYVVWALRLAKRPWQWLLAALLACGATYVCLTTFARGVYLSVAVPLVWLAGLLWLQRKGLDARELTQRFWHRLHLRTWRARAGVVLAMVLVLEVVGVFHGGSYMADRMAATDKDFGSRMEHWARGMDLLKTPEEWLWGQGLGRLPALYSDAYEEGERSGQVRLLTAAGPDGTLQSQVNIFGPQSNPDLHGFFALTQRVDIVPGQRYRVRLSARVATLAHIYLQVCERHLLYNGGCQGLYVRLQPRPNQLWQTITVPLQGRVQKGGPAYAPRLGMLAVSVLGPGEQLQLSRIELLSLRDNRQWLQNTEFKQNLAHWFPSAQTYFLPWHIDNLYLELLIERGWLGLLLTAVLVGAALWHLVLGRVRRNPLAPYVAASLAGVLIVGLVSSVMDVPRVAFLLFWQAFLALQIAPRTGATD
ncbi:hypothetical protein [Variovorax sp. HJSM1_2]|uniref:hypothetical protein n=1 Tax=Variovorax sp. HJSM1_2 TaxID=3366263 RepID=UPI003BDFE768